MSFRRDGKAAKDWRSPGRTSSWRASCPTVTASGAAGRWRCSRPARHATCSTSSPASVPTIPIQRSTVNRLRDRKLRLFAVACSRRFLHLLNDHRVGEALDIAERFADGLVGEEERSRARKAAQQAAQVRGTVARPDAPKWQRRAASLAYYVAARHATEAAWNVPGLAVEILVRRGGGIDRCDWEAIQAEGRVLCNLLRDIFGRLRGAFAAGRHTGGEATGDPGRRPGRCRLPRSRSSEPPSSAGRALEGLSRPGPPLGEGVKP